MTTKCANPACNHPFRYFRSGKIYLIDVANSAGTVRPSTGAREMEYFWLCGDCSQNMRVTLDSAGAVKVEALTAALPEVVAQVPIRANSKKAHAARAMTR